MSPHLAGSLLALLGVACFSVRPVLVKLAYAHGVDPTTLLALRLGFAFPFFAAVAAWHAVDRGGGRVSRRDWAWIVVLGFVGHYAASWLDMAGLQHVGAGLGRLILFLYPTIVVLLSAAFLGKPAGWREVVALASSYAGLGLVLLPGGGAGGSDVLRGAALILCGAALYAVYLVAGSQVIRRVGAMRFSANANIVSFLAIALHLSLESGLSTLVQPKPVYGLAVVIAIVSTVLPVFVVAEALRRVGANQVALIGAVGPVVALVLGHAGLDETMSATELAGAALILGGVVFVTVRPEAAGTGRTR
ncbi:MAG: DMT family transporter [Alphaproteobacteria bacterium]